MTYPDDQLTDWFPPHIKPVHVGVYPIGWGYAYWNGKRWGSSCSTPELAQKHSYYRYAVQDKHWRGLNFNPDAKGKK